MFSLSISIHQNTNNIKHNYNNLDTKGNHSYTSTEEKPLFCHYSATVSKNKEPLPHTICFKNLHQPTFARNLRQFYSYILQNSSGTSHAKLVRSTRSHQPTFAHNTNFISYQTSFAQTSLSKNHSCFYIFRFKGKTDFAMFGLYSESVVKLQKKLNSM